MFTLFVFVLLSYNVYFDVSEYILFFVLLKSYNYAVVNSFCL